MDAEKVNYVSWNRGWAAIRRHLPVVLKPLVAAGIVSLIWKLALCDNGIKFSKEAENPVLFIIIPLVGFIYVIFASLAVNSVFEEYKTISRSVVKSDLETFLIHRDEQLPIMMHILVGAPSLILILTAMLFGYGSAWAGLFSVFCVSFVVTLIWVIATELDDYRKSIWFKETIPEEWYKIDVQEFFKDKLK